MKIKIVLLLTAFLISSCAAHAAGIRFVSPNGTFEIEKDDVESVTGMSNSYNDLFVHFVFTEKGRKRQYLMTQKNAGSNVSVYFGDKLLWKDLYLPEPINSKNNDISVDTEDTMQQIIKYYRR